MYWPHIVGPYNVLKGAICFFNHTSVQNEQDNVQNEQDKLSHLLNHVLCLQKRAFHQILRRGSIYSDASWWNLQIFQVYSNIISFFSKSSGYLHSAQGYHTLECNTYVVKLPTMHCMNPQGHAVQANPVSTRYTSQGLYYVLGSLGCSWWPLKSWHIAVVVIIA